MRAALFFIAATAFAETCSNCHEIAPTADQWRNSTHRTVDCGNCHGGSLQAETVTRVAKHVRGAVPEQIRLKFPQVKPVTERCRSCHQNQYADWSAGPHGSHFGKILTDAKHNSKKLLMDDCFRCHGMFFDGRIGEAVTPVSKQGPWKLTMASLASEPVIPCIACHSVHTDGAPGKKRHQPSLAFWDRRSGEHILARDLAIPAMLQGDRTVRMSPDTRQAICYQCHAPLATRQAWSGDDRTPLGVHEGLSCLACHQKHGQDAAASCSTCHPRLSNCNRDVEKMDTTFVNSKSTHNVHTVACADCHPKGVPKPGPALHRANK